MTVKEEMHVLIEELPNDVVHEALDYLRWLAAETDTLTPEELAEVARGEEELARGEVVSLADLKHSLDR